MNHINIRHTILVSVLLPNAKTMKVRQIGRRPFYALKAGDVILDDDGKVLCTVGEDAHVSGDASYDGWLFYDTKGNSYFPEDFLSQQPVLLSFGQPITLLLDENVQVQAHTFKEYANFMQYPEPVFVWMENAVNDLLVPRIDIGDISAFDALELGTCGRVDAETGKCCMDSTPHYAFTEGGREYIQFAGFEDMKELLRWKGVDVG